jgi:hypothetical protein
VSRTKEEKDGGGQQGTVEEQDGGREGGPREGQGRQKEGLGLGREGGGQTGKGGTNLLECEQGNGGWDSRTEGGVRSRRDRKERKNEREQRRMEVALEDGEEGEGFFFFKNCTS